MLSFILMAKVEKTLYEIIHEMVKKIPKGKVATYGQIARLCGLHGHARLVGYALHNLESNSNVPWYLVINSKGIISLPRHTGAYPRQKMLLQNEGVVFKKDKVNLIKYGFGVETGMKGKVRRVKKQRGPEEARPR